MYVAADQAIGTGGPNYTDATFRVYNLNNPGGASLGSPIANSITQTTNFGQRLTGVAAHYDGTDGNGVVHDTVYFAYRVVSNPPGASSRVFRYSVAIANGAATFTPNPATGQAAGAAYLTTSTTPLVTPPPPGQTYSPFGLAVSADGSTLYVADLDNGNNGALLKYNVTTNTPVFQSSAEFLNTGPFGVALDNSNNVYVSLSNNTLVKYNVNDLVTPLDSNISTGLSNALGMAYDPLDSRVYVSSLSNGLIYSFDSNNLGDRTTFQTGFANPYGVAFFLPEPSCLAFLAGTLVMVRRPRRGMRK
jgi:hypothetical protein